MAFNFGQQSAPAFGAASSSLFGAASTPAFGAAPTPSLFGAGAPSPFGGSAAVSTPAFSFAQSSPSLFGAASAPAAFGASPSPSLFGGAPSPSPFGAAVAPSPFGAQPQQQQQQQQGLEQERHLATKDNQPVTHSTKWDDLSPQAQQYLLQLEKLIAQGRHECRQLDGEERLHSAAGARESFLEASNDLSRGIKAVHAMVEADTRDASMVRTDVLHFLRHTEAVLSSFKRAHAWREAGKAAPGGQPLPGHLAEQLGGPVALPSPFLAAAIKELEDKAAVLRAAAADLDAALRRPVNEARAGHGVDAAAALHSLQAAMANLHDCLVHGAARVGGLDEAVGAAKEAWLDKARREGEYSDPFAAAEQEERNKAAAAAKPKESRSGMGGQQPQAVPGTAAAPAMQAAAPAPAATGLFGTVTPQPAGFGTPVGGLFGEPTTQGRRRSRR